MSECKENRLIIVQGDFTGYGDVDWLTIVPTSEVWDLSTMKATFELHGIKKTFNDLTQAIKINYEAEQTSSMPIGDADGILRFLDGDNKPVTIDNLIPVKIVKYVHGDAIETSNVEMHIDVKSGDEVVMNVLVEAGVSVQEGTTYTLPAGQNARVVNRGTSNHLILDFYIPQGDKGEKGDTGDRGEQGERGPAGPQGPRGEQGVQGIQGPKGDTGPQGKKGDKGDKGDKGNTGSQGPQGPQGPKGDKGDKGDKGNTGATGPQGPQGIQGEQGPAGQDGTNGQDGQDGADAKINNVNTLTLTANDGLALNQSGNTATLSLDRTLNTLDTSGTISPATNTHNYVAPTGAITLSLPATPDTSIVNEIELQVNQTSAVGFDFGTVIWGDEGEPDMSVGIWDFIFTYLAGNWCGSYKKWETS